MTTAPYVELRVNPTDLRPGDLPRFGEYLGSPASAIEAALAVTRAAMVDEMKNQVRGIAEPNHYQLLRMADLAWQAVAWKYRKVSAPVIADAYIRAYRAADAGDVPMNVIYDLAEKHAEKVGDYFHETSRQALADGFSSMVNQRIPAKVAADRVMDAYGLTPRQMRGYTGSKFYNPVSSAIPRPLKAKARAYIDRSFTQRTRKLSRQEEHNIDEQAKQFAWMWLQSKGRLNEKAQKMWVTARDERVCPVCGPLHGKKVLIGQQFKTAEGAFWSPGLHPNCRCVVRLIENRFSKAAGSMRDDWDEKLHPRGYHGRFGTKTRTQLPKTKTIDVDAEFDRIITAPVLAPSRHLTYYAPPMTDQEPDHELDQQFAALVQSQPKTLGFTSAWGSPLEKREFLAQATEQISDPEVRLDFSADLALELRRQMATDPRIEQFKTPHVPLGDDAFAVITRDQLAEGDISRIRLNHGIPFTTDEIAAAQEAGEVKQRVVERAITDMVDKGPVVQKQDPKTGFWYHAELSPKDIERTAAWYANSATAHWHEDDDPDFLGDDSVRVNWRLDPGVPARADKGTSLSDRLAYSEIGEKYELRHSDFEVYVVRTDQAPADEDAVEDISGSANSRHRSFSIDGDYEIVPDSIGKVAHDSGYAVTTYRIEPTKSVTLPENDLNYPDKSE